MGTLLYGSQPAIVMDDRTLAHLQLAFGLKLRRNESFFFEFAEDLSSGSGRTVLWIAAPIPIRFRFSQHAPTMINRHWLDVLVTSSNSPRGLVLTEEPTPIPPR